MKERIAGLLLVLLFGGVAYTYYPLQCNPEHALTDFEKADIFAIGRVIGFERFSETFEVQAKDKLRQHTAFGFYARVKIGRVLKGNIKEGDEILVFEGCYEQPKEDNVEPVWVAQCNTHPKAGFEIGQSYVLAVNIQPNQEKKETIKYSLRSCHHSLYPLVTCIDERTEVRHTAVKLNKGKDATNVPLEKFLERITKKDKQ